MKTKLLIIPIALLFLGIIIFVIGVNIFINTQANEEHLESLIKAGNSVPVVNYDESWMYLKISTVFFGVGGFLLVWWKTK